jgi:hypothetical protein
MEGVLPHHRDLQFNPSPTRAPTYTRAPSSRVSGPTASGSAPITPLDDDFKSNVITEEPSFWGRYGFVILAVCISFAVVAAAYFLWLAFRKPPPDLEAMDREMLDRARLASLQQEADDAEGELVRIAEIESMEKERFRRKFMDCSELEPTLMTGDEEEKCEIEPENGRAQIDQDDEQHRKEGSCPGASAATAAPTITTGVVPVGSDPIVLRQHPNDEDDLLFQAQLESIKELSLREMSAGQQRPGSNGTEEKVCSE